MVSYLDFEKPVAELEAKVEELRAVAARSEERIRTRVDARAPLRREHLRRYRGHVLKELAGLLEEVRAVPEEADREALEMLFSAIVVKFSHVPADTAQAPGQRVERRIRKGLPTEFFVRRGLELARRWEALEDAAPKGTPPPLVFLGDARRLRSVLPRGARTPLVLSSPPYGGTYDYAAHHALRLSWLGMSAPELERYEIGARRNLSPGVSRARAPARDPADGSADPDETQAQDHLARWDRELGEALRATAEVLTPGGVAVWMLGDGQVAGRRVPADRQLHALSGAAGARILASASQLRADYTGGPERREHLIAFCRR